MLYMVTWIPSIYPKCYHIYIPYMDPMGNDLHLHILYLFKSELDEFYDMIYTYTLGNEKSER